jgi:hypothetical protein
VVLVIDATAVGDDEPFDTLVPADLGISRRELHRRALLYDPQGVISSLRPRLVAHLLERGGSVLLLDADMEVLGPLDDLWALADSAGVVLSPHAIDPLEGEPGAWEEEELLRSGAFNGGLLGVGPRGREFLAWLTERVDRDCVADPARGLFYSQTWLDLVPALFSHAILRDRGVNAMVHNLRGRDVEWADGRPHVAGTPLRLFHYTGFDPDDPDRLCRYFGDEFAHIGDRPGLERLARAYGDRLRRNGWPAAAEYPWAVLAGGLPVDRVIRLVFRRALLAAERGDGVEPPDPFGAGEDFVVWLREPNGDGLSPYLVGLRELRDDLMAVFPDVPGADTYRYAMWARGKDELPATLRPPA